MHDHSIVTYILNENSSGHIQRNIKHVYIISSKAKDFLEQQKETVVQLIVSTEAQATKIC